MMLDGCDPQLDSCLTIVKIPILEISPDTNPVIVPDDHVNVAIAHIAEVDWIDQASDLLHPTLPLYDPFGIQVAFDDGMI
jgi:hypothetical protein